MALLPSLRKITVTDSGTHREELAATQHEAGSVAQKVGDLYKIVMDSVKLNKDGVAPH